MKLLGEDHCKKIVTEWIKIADLSLQKLKEQNLECDVPRAGWEDFMQQSWGC